MSLPPFFKFEPIYKQVVWGGRRLGPLLGRELPGDEPIGESWEVVDLPGDQSVVGGGALAGSTLGDLREQSCFELMGDSPLLAGRFPLLLKFIDAARTLSVQVHPDDDACRRLGGGARPKTEAWYIIDRDPGAELFVGLRPGVTREVFAEAIEGGEVDRLLHRLPVEPGDFVYLPSGTIHAIGQGIVLAEVQQSSDTTYRVFDWNRVGLDGRPRQLHVAEALESIDYGQVGPPAQTEPASGRAGVRCPWFEMEMIDGLAGGVALEGVGPLALMGVREGAAVGVRAAEGETRLGLGETLLIPAFAAGRVEVEGDGGVGILAVRARAGTE
jgi:mannose-6-phosphate isomerase